MALLLLPSRPEYLTKKSLSAKRKICTTGQNCLRRLKQYKNKNLVKSFLKSRNSGDAGSWKDVLMTQLTPICLQLFFLFFQRLKVGKIRDFFFFFLVKNLEILLCDCIVWFFLFGPFSSYNLGFIFFCMGFDILYVISGDF